MTQQEIEVLEAQLSRVRSAVLVVLRAVQLQLTEGGTTAEERQELLAACGEVQDYLREDEDAAQERLLSPRRAEPRVATALSIPTSFAMPEMPDLSDLSISTFEDKLQELLLGYTHAPLNPTMVAAVHRSVLEILNRLSHNIGVGPEFWHVVVEPRANTLLTHIIPAPLVDLPRLDLEEKEGRWVAVATIDEATDPLTVVGSSEMEALIGLARVISVRRQN